MTHPKTALEGDYSTQPTVLYMGLELGLNKWKVSFSGRKQYRLVTIDGGDFSVLHEAIEEAKDRFKLEGEVLVRSCYEAGLDGFWLHRFLLSIGVENLVVDSASIEVNRRARRAKTDRLDARKLVDMLIRHYRKDEKVWSVVRVPSVEIEDGCRAHRELEQLKKERTSHSNRVFGLLMTQGFRVSGLKWREIVSVIKEGRLWDGSLIPENLKAELLRECERRELVHKQILELEKSQRHALAEKKTEGAKRAAHLMLLRSIGPRSSCLLSHEFFWRTFRNRREVGSAAGLTPTPYASGQGYREQSISKAGNRRVRTMIIEISWLWLRYQPNSKLSVWFNERFAQGSQRMRRIGITALARKLLIALWKFLKYGEIPEGAVLKTV